MAFKLNAGRGMMPKTGRGVPPTLMCGSPMKQEIELTKKYDEGKDKMAKTRSNAKTAKALGDKQGISIDPTTGSTETKKYEKTVERSGTKLRAKDGSGKIIEEVDWEKNSPTGGAKAEALTKKYKNMKKDTDTRRAKNKTQYDITSGNKSPNDATKEEKEILVSTGKATPAAKQMKKMKK